MSVHWSSGTYVLSSLRQLIVLPTQLVISGWYLLNQMQAVQQMTNDNNSRAGRLDDRFLVAPRVYYLAG